MIETTLNAIADMYEWFVTMVFMPTMTVVADNPWLVGIVLVIALVVIVVDTARTERSELVDEDSVTEAEWAARR